MTKADILLTLVQKFFVPGSTMSLDKTAGKLTLGALLSVGYVYTLIVPLLQS